VIVGHGCEVGARRYEIAKVHKIRSATAVRQKASHRWTVRQKGGQGVLIRATSLQRADLGKVHLAAHQSGPVLRDVTEPRRNCQCYTSSR
jgi:hypothetical protein